jgi:hypothetical protein
MGLAKRRRAGEGYPTAPQPTLVRRPLPGVRAAAVSALCAAALLGGGGRPLAAQQDTATAARDTARVSYLTREVVFVTAGREAGVAVGDTLELLDARGAVAARAVVVSVAARTASATPIPPGTQVSVGQLVRYRPHPAPAPRPAAAPAPAEPVPGVAVTPPMPAGTTSPPPPAPRRVGAARWRGNVQVDQTASSAGGVGALTTYQTSAALALSAPIASWLTFSTRTTTRWRSGGSTLASIGLAGNSTTVYQLEARIAPPSSWWNLTLGRFVPADAIGLGYVDGARLEVRPGGSGRLGFVAGYAPDVYSMAHSTQVARAGTYLGVTTPSFSASVSGATEWQFSRVTRTWASAQSFWSPTPRLSFSLLTDVDYGAGWEPFRGLRLTNLVAGLRAPLPLGFHGALSAESHAPLLLYSVFLAGDTVTLPGRLTGASVSLGREVLGSSLEITGGYLKRTTDPTPTYRGSLTLFNPHFMLVAMGQHGDLFDFGSVLLRLVVPTGAMPVTAAVSIGSNVTRTPGGAVTLWRYDLRPELGLRLAGGLYASVSADIGRYAGNTSTYLHAGVSYQLW